MAIGDLGWCALLWDGLRFLEGTGDDGVFVVMDVFEGDGCVVGCLAWKGCPIPRTCFW